MVISKLITYFKEKPLRLVIAFLLIFTAIGFILRFFTPQRQTLTEIPAPQISSLRQTTLQNTDIRIDLSKLPIVTTYKVFQATPVHLTLEQLGNKFRLNPTSFKNTWQDTSGKKLLVLDQYSKRFSYADNNIEGDFDAARVQKIKLDKAITVATTFVQNTLGYSSLSAKKDQVNYLLKSDTHPEEATAENGNLALIPFAYERDGFAFYSEKDIQPPIVVFVDSADHVTGFTASEFFFTLGSATPVQALQSEAVANEIKSGNFSIIRIQSEDPGGFDLKDVEILTATDVRIEYRYSATSNVVVPYYRIDATAKLTSLPTPIQLSLITPAIQTSVGNN